MIGYRISRAELEARIRTEKEDWLDRAGLRTETFRQLARYEEASSIWSEVKVIYMRLQGGAKCAYCERKLEAEDLGRPEQAVEHFRPKGNVRAWRVSKALAQAGVQVSAVPEEQRGYYLLPYHPFNYAAACHPCNTSLKGDRFPIAGVYALGGEDPADLKNERPYLIYPIGDWEDDPETLILFHGISPQPAAAEGHARRRGLATIEFFRLDQRKNLAQERARILVALYPQLEKLAGPGTVAQKKIARQLVDGFTHETAPHTNCARSFRRLFAKDRQEAEALFERAVALIASRS